MNNNQDCKAIHETVLKDIMDIWDDFKKVKEKGIPLAKNKKDDPLAGYTSIAKASSNLNLVFPVICSRGISIETASMISKAVEKNSITMLQRMFSSWQLTDDIKSAQDYINKFHNNLSSGVASLDDIFKITSDAIDNNPSKISNRVFNNSATVNDYEANKAIREDLRNINYYLPTSINENSLNRFTVKEGAVSGTTANSTGSRKPSNNGMDSASSSIKSAKDHVDYFKNQVLDNDFKKANELMPSSMVINFRLVDDDGKEHNYENIVIGVKAKLYPISSEDVVKHLADKTIERNWLTNFFRATTRETSFMKDFVLALDKAKIDAMSMSTRNSSSDRMWKVLERRATVSRLKRALRQNNTAAAITTLCISQEEVEYLRKHNMVDIEKISTIIGLFDSLNLICVCIVDEALEVAKFIYDEESPSWETISFTHLERESSDNTYKRVVNLITKMR